MLKIEEMRLKLKQVTEEVRTLMATDVSGAEEKMKEVRQLKKQIEMEEELNVEEERQLEGKLNKKAKNNNVRSNTNKKDLELRAISKVLTKKEMTEEERGAVTTENGNAILPQGFVKEIETLREGYKALKQYVHVIPVTTNTGKLPLSKGMDTKRLADLQHEQEIVKDMVTLTPVDYAVNDYGKIVPVENSVLEDTTSNFMNVLNEDFVECAVNTENAKIVEAVKKVCKETTATDYKGLIKAINSLSPNARKRAIIICNNTGFSYLDELEDKQGRPLLKTSYADGEETLKLKGCEVVEVDSEILADVTNKVEFYILDAKKVIKFLERKGYEVGVSSEAGFTYNQTFVRMLERFQVKELALKTDTAMKKFAIKVTITLA